MEGGGEREGGSEGWGWEMSVGIKGKDCGGEGA